MRYLRAAGWLLAMAACAADHKPEAPCTVSGSVVNAVTGEPLKKAQLTLSKTDSDASYAATTDAAGAFVLVATEAGVYELITQKAGFVQSGQTLTLTSGQSSANNVIRIAPQGVITGLVTDREGDPLSGVTVQAIRSYPEGQRRRYSVTRSAITNDLGEYRIYGLNPGRYYVGGAYRAEAGYAAVYFPNVQEASRAVAIDVPPGGEAKGLNLTVSELHSMRVRGMIQHAGGLPVNGIMIVAAPCDAGPLNRATTTVRKPDGAFELRDLTPGCYVLAADSFGGGKRYSARLPVTVARQSIEDVKLSLRPPVQLAGRVRVEGTPDFPFREVIVNLEARSSKLTAGGVSSDDGVLQVNNIVPEVYELSAIVPDGYYLKSAKYGEADVLRSGLDLSNGTAGVLEMEIGTDGGRIEGSVADGDGRPIDGARVALMPTDTSNGSLRQKITVSDTKGAFRIRGIVPGEYWLCASRNLEVSALQDPLFVGQLKREGKAVSIRERGVETVQLRAIGANAPAAR
jgi:protocatechuate 3,4-dioxygenase beta subunit